jgi:S1-C subfamily serine protease
VGVPLLSGLLGAAVALAVAALVGAFDRPTRVQVVERAAGTNPAVDDAEHVAQIATRNLPALVRVKAQTADGGRVGSGVTLSTDGIVLTSADLVDGATGIEIVDAGGRLHAGRVVGADPDSGLAVLDVEAEDLTVADFAEAGPTRVGETAVVLGAPSGLQSTGTVAVGVISGIGRVVPAEDERWLYGMLVIDRPIPPTAAGGAVLDHGGRVVAIAIDWPRTTPAGDQLTAPDDAATNPTAGLAVPIDQARSVAYQLLTHGHVVHAWLGIGGGDLGGPEADRLGVGGGVSVTRIATGSPAEAAGIRPGDVVTAIDGVAISGMVSLQAEVRDRGVGAAVALTVMRMGDDGPEALTFTVTAEAKPSR